MKLKKTLAACAVAASMTLTGCASIISDSQYPVSLQSTPDGASFTVTNKSGVTVHSGITPSTVTLNSGAGFFQGETYQVTFKKEGHAPSIITIDTSLDGWYIGNLLIGGLIGMLIVDPATGAMWKLPPSATATLGKQVTANGSEKTLKIVTIDQIPEDMKSQLVAIAH
ncbi:hypothetical protein [Parendozoicomonas haliclonae]|uniref:PEGA domain-containing protein n=1 Tax=Parendozoicomonas haliclonae TaxID=1960125 RepID=A0A1X7AR07_9GAMM|nr:hypothetical protein [Parendozoicomonas haliclonae]SMA50744.1 hypothetical protein EHSB41UT_04561 [Parendozoicomonas haliclonae]